VFSPQFGLQQGLDLLQQRGQLNTLLHGGLHVPPRLMLRLTPAQLRQLKVVVADVEPPRLPVLVGIDELVR
jgi:hypothetical protein